MEYHWWVLITAYSQVWMEEEGQEAEIALSRVLLARVPEREQRERAHWHNGFYSKPFKAPIDRFCGPLDVKGLTLVVRMIWVLNQK